MRRTLDVSCRARAGVRQWRVGPCRSDPERDRARSEPAAELMRSVFARLKFFAVGPSPAHIGGGHSSAMAGESVSYHRDEIQGAVRALPDQIGEASPAG